MTNSAFEASFSDIRIIKSRKVAQLIFELPIEAVDAALETLGGVPRPDREAWVGIARIKPNATPAKAVEPPKERRRWDELPLSQQAAIRCQEPQFQRFLNWYYHRSCLNAEEAAGIVRAECGVESRAKIRSDNSSGHLWSTMDAEYQDWLSSPSAF